MKCNRCWISRSCLSIDPSLVAESSSIGRTFKPTVNFVDPAVSLLSTSSRPGAPTSSLLRSRPFAVHILSEATRVRLAAKPDLFTVAEYADLWRFPCRHWWRLQPAAAPAYTAPSRTWFPSTIFLPSPTTFQPAARPGFSADSVPVCAVDSPGCSRTQFPLSTFLLLLLILQLLLSNRLPPTSIPATAVYPTTSHIESIYHGLPVDLSHRLLLHHRLSSSQSNPQHRSDVSSAILHWIHLSCTIRLIKACYF